MKKFFKHIFFVTKHKHNVFKLCCKCGLFWRGLVHDLSKFGPAELFESVKYYSGKTSPITECRNQKGYSYAGLHHKHVNKHHIAFWYDSENETQMNMPYQYAVECVCDKIAATKCYNGKNYKPEMVLNYWLKYNSYKATNINMQNFFTQVFTDLINLGEKQVLNKKYMKKTYNKIVCNKSED